MAHHRVLIRSGHRVIASDALLCQHIRRVWEENFRVYGARKVWRQLLREGFKLARCTVERLMKRLGLQGLRRGRSIRTTVSERNTPCPLDHVQRQFKASRPNELWVSDFTFGTPSQRSPPHGGDAA